MNKPPKVKDGQRISVYDGYEYVKANTVSEPYEKDGQWYVQIIKDNGVQTTAMYQARGWVL